MHDSLGLIDRFEQEHVRPRPGPVLIVGSRVYRGKRDRRAQFRDVTGIDMLPGPGVDRVLDLEEQLPDDLGCFSHIECMSVLEHSRRPWMLAANLQRLLVLGGTLFLTVPFVWKVHAYPGDYFRFTVDGVRQLFPSVKWTQLQYAHTSLSTSHKIPSIGKDTGEHPHLAKTEVVGFGVLR